MVSWFADGGISGYSQVGNTTNVDESALPGLTLEVTKLASPGTVDAQGLTRLHYDVGTGGNFRNGIDGVGRFNYSVGEIQFVINAGQRLGATMFVADSIEFSAGVVPSPSQILALGAAKLQCFRSPIVMNSTASAGNNVFPIIGPQVPPPNKKYWVMIMPTFFTVGTSPSPTNDLPAFGTADALGRAVSVWTNRTPLAPVITSPPANSVYPSGSTFDLSFDPKDPDKGLLNSLQGIDFDMAGVQVQYAPQPTEANPTPTWIDLPILDENDTPSNGWYIDRSAQNVPLSDSASGGFYFWSFQTMKVYGGVNLPPKTSFLPRGAKLAPGAWQIRIRTFDYGHAFPRFKRPLNIASGAFNAATYPAVNTSPWSTPVNVTVSPQVPPPVPISPRDATAVPVTVPITLRWQYRNTHTPPYPQLGREVQMREAGSPTWTTLASGYSASADYPLSSTAPPAVPTPVQYLANGGFETSTNVDGWTAQDLLGGTAPTLVNTNAAGLPGLGVQAGSRAMRLDGTNQIFGVVRTLALTAGHQFFSFTGWVARGNVNSQIVQLGFLDASGNQVGAALNYTVPNTSGWRQFSFLDMERPANATQIQIAFIHTKDAAGTLSGVAFDSFSFRGSTVRVSTPTPVYNSFTVQAGRLYEWRVRVTDTAFVTSDWSETARFWVVPASVSGNVNPVPTNTIEGATLGCGTHRVFVYRRGGLVRIGEITDISSVEWNRLRDDMSDARVVISGWNRDCGDLLARLQTWAYEIVIFRDNGFSVDRVWEGPITLLTYERDQVTIHAKDVIAYMYRRIVKQSMNDFGTSPTAGDSVVSRARRVIQNAIAPDDPNILRYLTVLTQPDDAKQYRSLPAYARTAYEEVDDMAANSGLDYCAVGRAIILWGTKHRIGTLPEFQDENLGSAPIVSEYGMNLSNRYAVSDGSGVYGEADRLNSDGEDPIYGLVEMLSSSWASDSEADSGTFTEAGLATVVESFEGFAEKSISTRYPPPVVVRVPDNTALTPSTVLSIQQLVPGVVIPLRTVSTLRSVAANQKLDAVKVIETNGNETISVTMSPFSRDDANAEEEA